MNLKLLGEKVQRAKFEFDSASRILETETKELTRLTFRETNSRAALAIIQEVGKEVQKKAYGCIASIVTKCLQTVFEEPYVFKIHFVSKRGQTEVLLKFERDGCELDPMTAAGGGVVDVASFALRLAALVLSGRASRRVLILDEPFRFLSAEYRGKIRDLLLLLSKELGIQLIMVTHIRELEVGKLVTLD